MNSLMVVIPDRLTPIIEKGEFTPRYYNPGNAFANVHLVLMNDDQPPLDKLRLTVGDADLHVHNFNGIDFKTSGYYRLKTLRQWAQRESEALGEIEVDLVRGYGHHLSTFAAAEFARIRKVPFVVSLHGNPDVDYLRGRLARNWRQRVEGYLARRFEVAALRAADIVLPVYSPIVPFLRSIGVPRFEVVHNAVGYGITPKANHDLEDGVLRAICVGRQEPGQKNPAAIVEAVARTPNVRLTLIGNGELHEALVAMVADLGIGDRVRFHKGMENAEVLREMQAADAFIYQSENYELSKGTMEAALIGLPIIVNQRRGGLAQEIQDSPFLIVQDNVAGYEQALRQVLADSGTRRRLGQDARRYALSRWDPTSMEDKVAGIYRTLVETSKVGAR